MSDFPHLLSPAAIGAMHLRNRIVLPGMDTNRCDAGELTDAEVDHYAARAAGGCPLVFTGASAIAWPLGATSTKQAALSDDRFLPGLRRLANAVHAHDGKVGVQLVHHGKVSSVDTAQGRPMLVPSIPPDRMDLSALADNPMDELMRLATATQGKPTTYAIATTDDIAWAVERFAEAAARVKSAGIDTVEIHGAHGYLISTFLSRAYNHRDDQYGGPLENRARILVEVIHAVRDRVGPDYPIVVRLNGCEYGIDDGITPDETAETARIAQAAGADAIHVSANAANPFRDFTLGPLPATLGQYREMAALVKRAVTIPVIAVGRLLPELAEEMVGNGECDFVSMGRQQLADPQLVAKLVDGRRRAIRPCINCYVCVEQNFFDASAICAVNPALGDEQQAAAQTRTAETSKHVVVVGGGPAGLEAARIAARRGHRVTILERSSQLGGSTWFAALTHSPNEMLIDWLCHEIADAGVDVELDVEATTETIAGLAPDVVIVATGAHSAMSEAVDSRETIEALATTGEHRRVTIIGGDLIGLSFAGFLADKGHDVTVLHPGPHLGVAMAMPRRWTAVSSLGARGVELVRGATITGLDGNTVRYSVEGLEHSVTFDHLIRTDDRRPDTTLAEQLTTLGISAHTVGDAASLGHLHGAMHSAHHVATTI